MQANDAELTRLYTAETGQLVENNEPNADGPATSYDLILQAVAGDPLGDSGTDYTLQIDCIDETLAAPADPVMSPGTLVQQFDNAAGNDWVRAGGDFVKEQRFSIDISTLGASVRGHVFRYVATLVSDNNDVVAFIESNKFVLV
jgi:hypothetical protein